MLTDADRAALEAAWASARHAGVLGSTTVQDLWEHTAGYTSAVCSAFSASPATLDARIVDVGTGAGVPGLLLARQLPHAQVTLVDASERRLDHVRRARRALGVEDRTQVVHGRAEELGHDPRFRAHFDVAVARLLGEPAETLELLLPLIHDGGVIVVSTSSRHVPFWHALPRADLPLGDVVVHGDVEPFVVIHRDGPLEPSWPRREKLRRRSPLGSR